MRKDGMMTRGTMRFAAARIAASLFAAIAFAAFVGCSSAPKAPLETLDARNEAARLLQLGAKNLREGSLAAAAGFYTEAYRLYTAIDFGEGRVRALDGLGRLPPTSGGMDTKAAWAQADRIARDSGEPEIRALATLLDCELRLKSADQAALEAILKDAASCADTLSRQPVDRARALRVAGSAAKGLARYPEALARFEQAAAIDNAQRAFIEYASDRYLAASVLSKQADYAGSQKALLEALESDRRAENAPGIGADYYALAQVALKSGDAEAARAWAVRAAEVYRAAHMEAKAAEAENVAR